MSFYSTPIEFNNLSHFSKVDILNRTSDVTVNRNYIWLWRKVCCDLRTQHISLISTTIIIISLLQSNLIVCLSRVGSDALSLPHSQSYPKALVFYYGLRNG